MRRWYLRDTQDQQLRKGSDEQQRQTREKRHQESTGTREQMQLLDEDVQAMHAEEGLCGVHTSVLEDNIL